MVADRVKRSVANLSVLRDGVRIGPHKGKPHAFRVTGLAVSTIPWLQEILFTEYRRRSRGR